MTEVLDVVSVTPPGSDVTVYCVTVLPPSSNGALHATVACPALDVAVTSMGAVGSNKGICARPYPHVLFGTVSLPEALSFR